MRRHERGSFAALMFNRAGVWKKPAVPKGTHMTKHISLQDCREAVAKNRVAMQQADSNFFDDVERRFEALRSKTKHPADFRRLSNELRNWVNNFVGRQDWNAKQDEPAYEGAMALLNIVDREIENRAVAMQTLEDAGLIRGAADGSWRDANTGKVVEIVNSDENLAKLRTQYDGSTGASVGTYLNGMLFGARSDAMRNALSEGTDSAGGYSVPTYVVREFFDKLRARTTFIKAGARTMILDTMKTRIVRTAADPVPAWRAENAAIAESNPNFEAVDFVARSLSVLVKVSREVLADSVNIDQALETALLGSMSVELDRACLFGAGTVVEPLGLFNTPGIGSVSLGANGAVISNYDPFVDALYEIEAKNAGPANAAIYNPRTARTLRKLKDTLNQPLNAHDDVKALERLVSTSVPINQTQGTEVAASTILVGDFSQAILGLRESLSIQRLDQAFAANGQIGFICHIRADVGFAHPESFCKILGVKP
jgi:HK97 family phage major capsid protein